MQKCIWQQIPAETQVPRLFAWLKNGRKQMELSRNSLLEFPGKGLGDPKSFLGQGVACLIALHEENAACGS